MSAATVAPIAPAATDNHDVSLEMVADSGYRRWVPMKESEVTEYLSEMEVLGYGLSDRSHGMSCWCGGKVDLGY